jgi:hypothetical protein
MAAAVVVAFASLALDVLLLLCCVPELLPAPCGELPADEALVVPLLWPLPALLLLLPLFVLLDCEAAGTFDDEDAEEDDDGEDGEDGGVPDDAEDEDAEDAEDGVEDGADDDACCAALLALCATPFCEFMLCCRVCANDGALAAFEGEALEPLEAPRSELISERGDMGDPVCPVNPVNSGHSAGRGRVTRPRHAS